MGCLDPYEPPVSEADIDLLVVDGIVNVTDQSASVRLTKSLPLEAAATVRTIDDAQVSIEQKDGITLPLQSLGNGKYEISSVAWNVDAQYRLSVDLASGESYRSDFITLTRTPAIDSITYREGKDALNFYVNTHDPTGVARHFKWDYEETWEHTASFVSFFKLVGGLAIERTVDERIHICWTDAPSTAVRIYDTSRLSEDVVSDFLLNSVPAGSEQLSRRYSMKVKQRTLSEEEFNFWDQLKNTTEELGGLFDPLPYSVVGNIHGVNNNRTVLGYFGGGEVQEQRIFVSLSDLPRNIALKTMRSRCYPEEIQSVSIDDLSAMSPASTILLEPIYVQGGGIVGYTFSYPSCADCRTQGGTTRRPDFW